LSFASFSSLVYDFHLKLGTTQMKYLSIKY